MSKQEKWYGRKGVDTPYERSLIFYRPNLVYPEKESSFPMNKDIIRHISRSQDFRVVPAIIDYRNLAIKIEELLLIIENRQEVDIFLEYKSFLEVKNYEEVFKLEKERSSYVGELDFEMYTILYLMKNSVEQEADFLDEYYRTQFTEETEDELMIAAEGESINEWIKTEYELTELYHQGAHGEEDSILNNKINRIEIKRRSLDQLHTTMADTVFTHRNRYLNLDDIISKAEKLINKPQQLIEEDIDVLINQISESNKFNIFQSHLILQFKELQDKHFPLKNQLMNIDNQKEAFISEKSYMYQQLVTKSNDEVRNWLYEQPDIQGKSFNMFASLMTDSIENVKNTYENTLADLMSFYRQESVIFGRQITLIQKKEEIRQFISILKDLEEMNEINTEIITNYLTVKGYTPRAI